MVSKKLKKNPTIQEINSFLEERCNPELKQRQEERREKLAKKVSRSIGCISSIYSFMPTLSKIIAQALSKRFYSVLAPQLQFEIPLDYRCLKVPEKAVYTPKSRKYEAQISNGLKVTWKLKAEQTVVKTFTNSNWNYTLISTDTYL
jgi:hypothetical protein